MKFLLSLATVLVASQAVVANNYNVTCFYDMSSVLRGGSANFTLNDLETSLQLCTHVMYGYVGILPGTFNVVPLDKRQLPMMEKVRDLKKKYRNVKFLLSLGGNMDFNQPEKYMQLLERGALNKQTFVNSAVDMVKKYQFDGMDLAYQLPSMKALKRRSQAAKIWKKAKKAATTTVKGNLNELKGKKTKAKVNYKPLLTQLIGDLKTAFRSNKLMLTLTVVPNVNSSRYFDVPAIMANVDFVNLATFDFSTPRRTPKVADYLAPLYAPPKNAVRSATANVDSQIHYWVSQSANPKQLIMGIPAYGRTWEIKKILKSDRLPIVSSLNGAAPADARTRKPGLIDWSEVCTKVKSMTKFEDKKYGNYAYRAIEVKGTTGLLMTYENVASITEKAEYVKNRGIGGMALFDLSLDDFRGQCGGDKFVLLKTIRSKLV